MICEEGWKARFEIVVVRFKRALEAFGARTVGVSDAVL